MSKAHGYLPSQKEAVYFDKNYLLILAGAGTGKTTVLKGHAEYFSHQPMLYLCYNSSIQQEASRKFPPNVKCRTLHAIAFARVGKAFDEAGQLVDNYRITDVKNFLKCKDWDTPSMALSTLNAFLCSADKSINESHLSSGPKGRLIAPRLRENVLIAAKQLWEAATSIDVNFPITHDGYLKLYALQKPEMHRWFKKILFDEAQDANPVVSDWVERQKCAIIEVGDEHQQLYRFRGANNSMAGFAKRKKAKIVKLQQSFRFGENVADLATRILDYKAEHTGCDPFPIKGLASIEDALLPSAMGPFRKQPYAYLHRTVAGTFESAIANIDKRIYWIGGIEKYNFQELLDVYYFSIGEKSKVKRKKLFVEFRSYDDYKTAAENTSSAEMMRNVKLIDKNGNHLIRLIAKLRKLEARKIKDAELIVGTAHRSKGLEFDYVRLADDFPDVTDQTKFDDMDILADELNLLYVASTRAMRMLVMNEISKKIYLEMGGKGISRFSAVTRNEGPPSRPSQPVKLSD
tara:strand:+ start:82875 stop:84425 length:1551 start_codon:yes stop_codon:yes gene_type:complete